MARQAFRGGVSLLHDSTEAGGDDSLFQAWSAGGRRAGAGGRRQRVVQSLHDAFPLLAASPSLSADRAKLCKLWLKLSALALDCRASGTAHHWPLVLGAALGLRHAQGPHLAALARGRFEAGWRRLGRLPSTDLLSEAPGLPPAYYALVAHARWGRRGSMAAHALPHALRNLERAQGRARGDSQEASPEASASLSASAIIGPYQSLLGDVLQACQADPL